ncbi:WecB/TagA/CpsF family glycosyltransferase [Candidatus Woesearchaeota archaeon]|nr:WecB/TagA/CpsF family glycosyltransferase [Candidatus Woesearchaeota archaeon]
MLKIDNFRINTESREELAKLALSLIKRSKKTNIVQTINAHSFVAAQEDLFFREALENADILLPDGASISIATCLFNIKPRLHHRVPGPDFFMELTGLANKERLTYFFMGSSEEVLGMIRNRMKREYPNIKVHTLSPPIYPFEKKVNCDIIKKINKAKPDVLWVGMTAPKQEKWTYENRLKLKVPLVASIGAAFDFYAGTRKRAPLLFQRLNLEWLYRFILEPRRMWKRYINSNVLFAFYMVLRKVRR